MSDSERRLFRNHSNRKMEVHVTPGTVKGFKDAFKRLPTLLRHETLRNPFNLPKTRDEKVVFRRFIQTKKKKILFNRITFDQLHKHDLSSLLSSPHRTWTQETRAGGDKLYAKTSNTILKTCSWEKVKRIW